VGFFGIDVFFVISGFVISLTVFPEQRNLQGAATFLRRRLARVYLGYWPFGLLALYALPLHNPADLLQVSTFLSLALTNADLTLLALPVAWSLAYELYFYALFGLLYCCSNAVIKRALLAIFALLLVRVLWLQVDTDSRLYFGISAAAIVTLALQLEANGLFKAPGWLVSLGDSSYALYLSHLFIITAFYQWGWRDNLAAQSPWLVELGFLALLLYIVFLAHFWYQHLERPLYLKAIGKSADKVKEIIPAKE